MHRTLHLEYTGVHLESTANGIQFPDSSMTVTVTRFSDTLAGQTGVSYWETESKILKMHFNFNRCSKMQIKALHNYTKGAKLDA